MSAGFIAFALLVWVIKAWPALALLAFSFACYQVIKADNRRGCAVPPPYVFGTDAVAYQLRCGFDSIEPSPQIRLLCGWRTKCSMRVESDTPNGSKQMDHRLVVEEFLSASCARALIYIQRCATCVHNVCVSRT